MSTPPALVFAGVIDAKRHVNHEIERFNSLYRSPTVGFTAIIDGEQAVEIGGGAFLTRSGKEVQQGQWTEFAYDNSLAEEIIYESWAHAHNPEEAATNLPVYLRTIRVCGDRRMFALVIPASSTAVDFHGTVWDSYEVEESDVVPDHMQYPESAWHDPAILKKCRDGVFEVCRDGGVVVGVASPASNSKTGWEFRASGGDVDNRTPAQLADEGYLLSWRGRQEAK